MNDDPKRQRFAKGSLGPCTMKVISPYCPVVLSDAHSTLAVAQDEPEWLSLDPAFLLEIIGS
jgi:hypothetical protein